jgi:hypothetical protein
MAITVTGYPLGWLNVWEQNIDLEGATNVKLSLHTSAYTPNYNTHDFFDDATNQLATANGYSRATLTNVALAHDATTDQIRLDFDDVSWTFTGDTTWRYGVVWVNTAGAASTDPLLLLLDWGSSQTVSGVYTITLDSTGIFAFDFGSL